MWFRSGQGAKRRELFEDLYFLINDHENPGSVSSALVNFGSQSHVIGCHAPRAARPHWGEHNRVNLFGCKLLAWYYKLASALFFLRHVRKRNLASKEHVI